MKKLTPVETLKKSAAIIDRELSRSLSRRAKGPDARMYNMLRYFLGFLDTDFKSITKRSGKRFRPGLSLALADAYGVRHKVLDAAIAIELFHNFTLIHDDVEDHDEMRRGRPTVWKLWGVNDAINSGDALNILVAERISRVALVPKVGSRMASILTEAFLEVIEGQHLDFQLASAPINSKEMSEARYLSMIKKKTGALIRASVEVAGIAAGKGPREIAILRQYGESLGLAFQLADDYQSVWGSAVQTGKDAQSDIREHKRTSPFLYAYAHTKGVMKTRFNELYSLEGQLTESQIREARTIIDATDAHKHVLSRIRMYAKQAQKVAQSLSAPESTRAFLLGLVDLLVPDIPL